MYSELTKINHRPAPFEIYTAEALWTDEFTSEQMLSYHLNGDVDVSSRNKGFIDRSAEWISQHFNIGPDSRIIDFGCGPGLYTSRLARTQASVTGIDFSERSIQYARDYAKENGLNITYINENYLDFETELSFDLVLMIMCDFCALSPVQRRQLLNKFRSILKPDGTILLDVYSLSAFDEREETALYEENQLHGFWSPVPYYGFLNTFKYDDEKIVLDKYTIIEPAQTRTIYNWLQYFSTEDIKKEFEASGLQIKSVYADVCGNPFNPDSPEFAVTAGRNRLPGSFDALDS